MHKLMVAARGSTREPIMEASKRYDTGALLGPKPKQNVRGVCTVMLPIGTFVAPKKPFPRVLQ
jgi:hypothetical protein